MNIPIRSNSDSSTQYACHIQFILEVSRFWTKFEATYVYFFLFLDSISRYVTYLFTNALTTFWDQNGAAWKWASTTIYMYTAVRKMMEIAQLLSFRSHSSGSRLTWGKIKTSGS